MADEKQGDAQSAGADDPKVEPSSVPDKPAVADKPIVDEKI